MYSCSDATSLRLDISHPREDVLAAFVKVIDSYKPGLGRGPGPSRGCGPSLLFMCKYMNFHKLEVYQTAIRFLPPAIEIADKLPTRYSSMADQLRRAALSISLNIAEGSGKITGPDQRRFFSIARGSTMECAAIIDACSVLALVGQIQTQKADQLLLSMVKMLSKMCILQRSPCPSSSPGPGPGPGPGL